jgi:hypothetical protein
MKEFMLIAFEKIKTIDLLGSTYLFLELICDDMIIYL